MQTWLSSTAGSRGGFTMRTPTRWIGWVISALMVVSGSSCHPHDPIGYTRANISAVHAALLMFHVDNQRYPSEAEGLISLVTTPPTAKKKGISYLQSSEGIKDGWGRLLVFHSPGVHAACEFEVISYGKDGRPGGEGNNEDIIYCWQEGSSRWLSGGIPSPGE